MTTLTDTLDRIIAIRKGDVLAFKTARHLTAEELYEMQQMLKDRLDPLGITWLIVAPDIDIDVLRLREAAS